MLSKSPDLTLSLFSVDGYRWCVEVLCRAPYALYQVGVCVASGDIARGQRYVVPTHALHVETRAIFDISEMDYTTLLSIICIDHSAISAMRSM